MAKKGQTFRKYSLEFKLSVILDMRQDHLSYSETVRKYGLIGASKGGAMLTLHRWERKYLEEGFDELMKDNRGKPSLTGKKRGRPPKLDKKVKEDLIAENQRLRMELEYLKTERLSSCGQAREREKAKVIAELMQRYPLKDLLELPRNSKKYLLLPPQRKTR